MQEILSYGNRVKVIAPEGLPEEVQQWMTEMLGKY
jgi:predicted DNA-binding transcriptional regulator YafY